ncbi:hypothetical protein NMY22_g4488 [Coprinellus aureogranulatus]|nr:hypothetical protein NMY22_g4488 [Coprinellus aureogranulatus]
MASTSSKSAKSRRGGTSTRACGFQRLPEEMLHEILNHCVYVGDEFNSELEYGDMTRRGSQFSLLHSWFAEETLLVNKLFWRIGIRVLWKFVIVRSQQSLQSLVEQIRQGGRLFPKDDLSTSTERLQIRISGDFDRQLVANLISAMPKLKVFATFNTPQPGYQPQTTGISVIAPALCRSNNLIRLQLDSPGQNPTLFEVRDILEANPQLVAFRTQGLAPLHPIPQHQGLGLSERRRRLKAFSTGFTEAEDRGRPVAQAFNSLLRLLCVAPTAMFPRMTEVYFLEYIPVVSDFLEIYGRRLRHLLYSTPDHMNTSQDHPNFLKLCPRLRCLIWVVTHWPSVNDRHKLPNEHEELRLLTIVYPEGIDDSSDTHLHLQRTLETVQAGRYLKLRRIQLKAGGRQCATG